MKLKDWQYWEQLPLKKELLESIPDKPKVYRIICNKEIERAIRIDTKGILYIGESTDLRYRITKFINCAQSGYKSGHVAGRRYYSTFSKKNF